MLDHAQNLEFEEAAQLRDQVIQIKRENLIISWIEPVGRFSAGRTGVLTAVGAFMDTALASSL